MPHSGRYARSKAVFISGLAPYIAHFTGLRFPPFYSLAAYRLRRPGLPEGCSAHRHSWHDAGRLRRVITQTPERTRPPADAHLPAILSVAKQWPDRLTLHRTTASLAARKARISCRPRTVYSVTGTQQRPAG